MEASRELVARLQEVLINGKWIANTNYKKQLESLNWHQAIQKIHSLNTIAALTYHINYYLAGIINVFEGGSLDIRDKFSFDLPEIKSQEDWKKLRSELFINSEKFIKHVELMSDEKLENNFVKKEYGSYRRNIEGVIEHSYYHLGQISLIKKMIEQQTCNVIN